jgi:LysR family glycine cleavage system transcriptional activator
MAEGLPPLASLYAFMLVAETRGLAAAAERLNVTQPAISRRVRDLEAHLGVALIERGVNSIALTDAGASYARKLATGFATIRAATTELARDTAAPLRVRAHNTWALRWLIPRLPRFRASYPEQEIEVTTSPGTADFMKDAGDIAIRMTERAPTPTAERMQSVAVAPFAAPALAARLRKAPWGRVALLGSRRRPHDWERWSAGTGVTLPTKPLLYETTLLAVQAAIESMGAVIVSPSLVAEDVRQRRLVRVAEKEVLVGSHYWLIMPPGTARPVVLAFRLWLLREIATEEAGAL